MLKLVLISGQKRTGKSTFAKQIAGLAAGRHEDVEIARMAYADPIHDTILRLVGRPVNDPSFDRDSEIESEKYLDLQHPLRYFGHSYRDLLISFGTDWGRRMVDENIWTEILAERIAKFSDPAKKQLVIVDDLRIPNEKRILLNRLEHYIGGDVFEHVHVNIVLPRADQPKLSWMQRKVIDLYRKGLRYPLPLLERLSGMSETEFGVVGEERDVEIISGERLFNGTEADLFVSSYLDLSFVSE